MGAVAISIIAWRELLLFAGCGFLIGGIEELIIDLIWIFLKLRKLLFVYSRHRRATAETLGAPAQPGKMIIFIAAWDEAAVIIDMLTNTLTSYDHPNYRIYLGCYPNDHATQVAARTITDARLRIVIGRTDGPTTKADCLNTLWHALLLDEAHEGFRAKAIVLHDAEDVVHPQELNVFDRLIERFALVQLPVLPLINRQSLWVAGHYCDEFVEAHERLLVVREALGASLPSAGVGTAFSRDVIVKIADMQNGNPFDADSLTEDYELGLKIGALGERGVLARLPSTAGIVQVRAHFPATINAAIRQKTRWITGIALAGYDRLGWRGGFAERWMRLHDRRALIDALVLTAGYALMVLTLLLQLSHFIFMTALPVLTPVLRILLAFNVMSLIWRAIVRAFFVTRRYGWIQGCCSIPRIIISSIIAMIAARNAISKYLKMRRTGLTIWDKTQHIFPTQVLE